MDTNYITLGVAVVGFVSTLLTHKYHINLHSKKLEAIEKDVSNVLTAVNKITDITAPKLSPIVKDANTILETVEQQEPPRLG